MIFQADLILITLELCPSKPAAVTVYVSAKQPLVSGVVTIDNNPLFSSQFVINNCAHYFTASRTAVIFQTGSCASMYSRSPRLTTRNAALMP